MIQGEHCFNEAHDARRRIEMTDTGFESAKRAVLLAVGIRPKRLRQSRDFDGISQGCSGAMSFNVGDIIGHDPGNRLCLGNDLGLTINTRSREPYLERSVIIDGGPFEDGVNGIFIIERFL